MNDRIFAHIRRALLLAIVAMLGWGSAQCSFYQKKEVPDSFHFVVTGNTYPDSPFKWNGDMLGRTVASINRENPLFVIHTGDMIYGGQDWMGLREEDLSRQFDDFFRVMKSLDAILYPMAGDKDKYNGSRAVYENKTGRKASYSFNYGNAHFVILETSAEDDRPVSDETIRWFEGDLKANRGKAGIIVVTHHALVKKGRNGGECLPLSAELHAKLRESSVIAVISGGHDRYMQCDIEGVAYIVTGCGGFRDEDRYRQTYQYYVVDFDGHELRVQGKAVLKQ